MLVQGYVKHGMAKKNTPLGVRAEIRTCPLTARGDTNSYPLRKLPLLCLLQNGKVLHFNIRAIELAGENPTTNTHSPDPSEHPPPRKPPISKPSSRST